jgi:nucleoside-diphosphate-sugar epimerase
MQVLVTGAAGFLGGHVVDALLDAGHAVRALVRRDRDRAALERRGAEVVVADLVEDDLDGAVRGVDAVAHLAARSRGTRRALWQANVWGTERLLSACRRAGAPGLRFVFASTQAVAGPSLDGRPRTPDEPAAPWHAYGESKWRAERLVRARDRTWTPVVLRLVAVYGPGDPDTLPLFRFAVRGWALIPAAPGARFHVVYAADAARAFVRAVERPEAAGACVFVGHPRAVSWSDVVSALEVVVGRALRRVEIPRAVAAVVGRLEAPWARLRGRRPLFEPARIRDLYASWLCDVGGAESVLGWRAETDLVSGFRRSLDAYRAAGWL